MRNEDDRLLELLEEATRIGKVAGIPVQISRPARLPRHAAGQ